MTAHMKSAHTQSNFSCNKCNYKSDHKSHMKLHNESRHDNVNEHVDVNNEEWQISTQELIEDSRKRRALKKSGKGVNMKCDESKTLLMRHTKTDHGSTKGPGKKVVPEEINERAEKGKYVSKRIKCEKYNKKFNKIQTNIKHMESINNEITKPELPRK